MFKTIARPDHSERILATPPQHCISLNEARMLKGILLEKLPPGSTVAILGAPPAPSAARTTTSGSKTTSPATTAPWFSAWMRSRIRREIKSPE